VVDDLGVSLETETTTGPVSIDDSLIRNARFVARFAVDVLPSLLGGDAGTSFLCFERLAFMRQINFAMHKLADFSAIAR